jgi:hypothetical protein
VSRAPRAADSPRLLDCSRIEPLLVFYACDEANSEERAAVETHVSNCANCSAALAEELRLRQMLSTLSQPAGQLDGAGALLAQCRSELAEALDDSRDGIAQVRRGIEPQGLFARALTWCRMEFATHPVLGAAFFVLIGLGIGRMAPELTSGSGLTQAGLVPAAMTVSAEPRISEQELQGAAVQGIYVVRDANTGATHVEVDLREMKPRVVAGGADDTDVKRVLSFVMANTQRFDSDLRMDSVDVLRSRMDDPDVRREMCSAALNDPNPGVRLRALESLHGFEQDEAVRDTLVNALLHDTNPGVRMEAVNDLSAVMDAANAPTDAHVLQVLRDLSEHDANSYIRLQASAAIRQIGAAPPQH